MALTTFLQIPFASADGNQYYFNVLKEGVYNVQTLRPAIDVCKIAFADATATDLKPVCGQKLDAVFFSKKYNQFKDFFTSDSFAIKGELTTGGSTVWSGWLIPEQYQASHGGAKLVKLSFRCGLAILKDFKFADLGYIDPTERVTLWNVITTALSLTGLTNKIAVFSDIQHEGTTGDNWFKETLFTPDAYDGDTVFKILEDILKGHRLTLDVVETDGGPVLAWTIYTYSTLISKDLFTPELYNADGTDAAAIPYAVINQTVIGAKTPRKLEAFPGISYDAPVDRVEVGAKYKSRDLIFNPKLLNLDVEGVPDGWGYSSAFFPSVSTGEVYVEQDGAGDRVLQFTRETASTAGTPASFNQQIRIPVIKDYAKRQLILSFDYAIGVQVPYALSGNKYSFPIMVIATLDGGSTIKYGQIGSYFGRDGVRVYINSSINRIRIPYDDSFNRDDVEPSLFTYDFPSYENVSLDLSYLYDTVSTDEAFIDLIVSFGALESQDSNTDNVSILRIKNVSVKYIDHDTGKELSPPESVAFGPGVKLRELDTKIGTEFSGDIPAHALGGVLSYDDAGTIRTIRNWTADGVAFSTYQELIADYHLQMFAIPVEKLDVTVRKQSKWTTRLTHDYDLSNYLFSGAEWDVQANKVSGQLINIQGFNQVAAESLLINGDGDELEVNNLTNETLNTNK